MALLITKKCINCGIWILNSVILQSPMWFKGFGMLLKD